MGVKKLLPLLLLLLASTAGATDFGGYYWSSAPTLSNGQGYPLRLDNRAQLVITCPDGTCSGGGSGGGTSSNFGDPFPTKGTAAGFLDQSGNMSGAKLDSNQFLMVTFSNTTIAITAASLPLPTNAAKETGGNLDTLAGGVSGGKYQINAASLPLPSNAAQETGGNLAAIKTDTDTLAGGVSGSLYQSNVADWAGTALGAMANYGTSPGAVKVPGVNSFITNTVTATCNAGTNLNTSALALESGGNLAAIKTDTDTIAGAVSSNKVQDNLAQVGGQTTKTNGTDGTLGTFPFDSGWLGDHIDGSTASAALTRTLTNTTGKRVFIYDYEVTCDANSNGPITGWLTITNIQGPSGAVTKKAIIVQTTQGSIYPPVKPMPLMSVVTSNVVLTYGSSGGSTISNGVTCTLDVSYAIH